MTSVPISNVWERDHEQEIADLRDQLETMRKLAAMLAADRGDMRLANRCLKNDAHHAMALAEEVCADGAWERVKDAIL